jgi:indole-3-glycerol phosphate synthase
MSISSILEEIVAHKRQELERRRVVRPVTKLQRLLAEAPPQRNFAGALKSAAENGRAGIIAEIKRGSPSLGCIRPDLDAAVLAVEYAQGGAAALSILTDEQFFFGSDADLVDARASVDLPVLRKEFIIDEYQLFESRVLGADCILLILALLDDRTAANLAAAARRLGLQVLVEAHDAEEVARAQDHVEFDLLGINNRDLNTFDTDTDTTVRLAEAVRDRDRLVAESGLGSVAAIRELWEQGIRNFLVGEAFVTSPDPARVVHQFVTMQE